MYPIVQSQVFDHLRHPERCVDTCADLYKVYTLSRTRPPRARALYHIWTSLGKNYC
jgi:hypothetical protein